jgi:replicative DNA helicase
MQKLEHEKAIVGAIVRDESFLPLVSQILTPECFVTTSLRTFYATFLEMAGKGKAIDLLTVQAYMDAEKFIKSGGIDALTDCMGSVPYGDHIEEYALEVAKMWQQRTFDAALKQAIALNQSDGLAAAQDFLNGETLKIEAKQPAKGFRHVSESLTEWFEEFEKGLVDPTLAEQRFLPTGNIDYDEKFGGLRKGLNVLAARPAMGKSAYALTEALNIAKRGKSVLIVSLEMPDIELDTRLISAMSGVNSARLEKFQIEEATGELADIVQSMNSLMELPIWFETVRNVDQIISSVNHWRRVNHRNPDVVFVDYLQLIDGGGEQEYANLTAISQKLMYYFKFVAECPCRLLCQLSRKVEERNDKRPTMSDIRGSGGIEQDADVIDLLYRDEYYNKDSHDIGIAEVIRAKSRQSQTGTVKLFFDAETTSFKALLER